MEWSAQVDTFKFSKYRTILLSKMSITALLYSKQN